MKAGQAIYSFLTTDGGRSFTLEPGTRLTREAFTEFSVSTLNGPYVIQLPDGRFRMYVAASVPNPPSGEKWIIVSATTERVCGDLDGDGERTFADLDVFVPVLLGMDPSHITPCGRILIKMGRPTATTLRAC